MVGVYCDKQLIGQSYGETLDIAEEMAARDALRNIFQTAEHSDPRPYGQELPETSAHVNIESYSVEPRNIISC